MGLRAALALASIGGEMVRQGPFIEGTIGEIQYYTTAKEAE